MCTKAFHYSCDSLVDTSFQVHRISACSHVLKADVDDGLSENGGSGGTVTCLVIGLGSDFLDHLGTHIRKPVLEFDFLCDRNTVLCHVRSTELLVDDHVATLWSESDLDCISESVHSFLHLRADINIEFYFLCHNDFVLKNCQNIRLLDDQVLDIVDSNLGARILSIDDLVTYLDLHRFILLARADCEHLAFRWFLFCCVRNIKS